jgi:hypothetical protein
LTGKMQASLSVAGEGPYQAGVLVRIGLSVKARTGLGG